MMRATAPYRRVPERGWHPGVTVLEILVTLSLLAAVVAAASAAAGLTARIAHLHGGRLDAQQGSRRALDRMLEELRWAEAVLPDPLCGSGLCPSRVRVRIPGGNPYRQDSAYDVTFQHNPLQSEVERRVGSGTNNLAALIHRVEFLYFASDGLPAVQPGDVVRIRVSLTAVPRADWPVTLSGEVTLRNRRLSPALTPATPTPSPQPLWRPAPRRTFAPGRPPSQTPPPSDDSEGMR